MCACRARAKTNARVFPLTHHSPSTTHPQRASLVAVQAARPTLASVVAADVATKTATSKGSPTRNLHRIASSLAFLADLLSALAANPTAPLRPAAADAYGRTLAAAHNGLLRAGVRASLYLLPDRAMFLASAGEPTDNDARTSADAAALARVLAAVVARIEALFAGAGVKMPVSDVRWLPSGGGATVAAG